MNTTIQYLTILFNTSHSSTQFYEILQTKYFTQFYNKSLQNKKPNNTLQHLQHFTQFYKILYTTIQPTLPKHNNTLQHLCTTQHNFTISTKLYTILLNAYTLYKSPQNFAKLNKLYTTLQIFKNYTNRTKLYLTLKNLKTKTNFTTL